MGKGHIVLWSEGHFPEWTTVFEVHLRTITSNLLVSIPPPIRFILRGYCIQCQQTSLSHTDTERERDRHTNTHWGCSSYVHVLQIVMYDSNVQSAFSPSHLTNTAQTWQDLRYNLKVSSSSFICERHVYDKAYIGTPMSNTHTHTHTSTHTHTQAHTQTQAHTHMHTHK